MDSHPTALEHGGKVVATTIVPLPIAVFVAKLDHDTTLVLIYAVPDILPAIGVVRVVRVAARVNVGHVNAGHVRLGHVTAATLEEPPVKGREHSCSVSWWCVY